MADVTIYTLAKELNMTPSMVSRAFNQNARISHDKRELVLKTAEKYGFVPNKFASRLSMKAVKIGVLINSRFKINSEKMISGIESAYSEVRDYKIEYEITMMNPFQNTLDDYARVILSYKDFDGVILTGMSSSKYTEMINSLYSFNKNIVQVQAINDEASYLFGSKHDEETASRLAAEFLYNCLKRSTRRNVLLFTGDLDTTLHKNASIAFARECEKLGLRLLDTIDIKDSEEYFTEILPKVFSEYKGITDAIYTTSGLSSPLCGFIEKEGFDPLLVTFDTHSEIREYIEKGIINATISQDVTSQARNAFELLVKHIISGKECPKTIFTNVQLVLKSNIHQFD